MNFEVYRKSPFTSLGEQWQWRLRTSSGQVVAKGASYPNLKTCMQAIVQVKKEGIGARVVNPKNGLTFVGIDPHRYPNAFASQERRRTERRRVLA